MTDVKRWPSKRVPISSCRVWEKNPRAIKKGDFDRLKKQIVELGQYKPLVATADGRGFVILGGNMRLRALKEIGATDVELTIVDAPTEELRIKYSLSDNDRAGMWDDQALAELIFNAKDALGDLGMFRIDLAPTLAIDRILDSYGPSHDSGPEDEVPKPALLATTRPGDVFTLGRHRLVCGDATTAWSYDAILEGKKADLIFTDPPYNVDYVGQQFAGILNDNMSEDGFIGFTEAWMGLFQKNLKLGGVFYICSGYSSYPPFIYAIKKSGLTFSTPIIWVKNHALMNWPDYHGKNEMILKGKRDKKTATPILYGWNKGRHYFSSDRFEADVWEHPRRASAKMLHPTQKPLSMVQRAIKNSTRPGEIVLDAFAGSGTTMIAAEREGRRAAMIELDPYFCDVIIRRYAAQGGQAEAEIRATRRSAEIPKADRQRMDGQRAGAAAADAKLKGNSKRRSGGDAPIPPEGRGKAARPKPAAPEGGNGRGRRPDLEDPAAGTGPVHDADRRAFTRGTRAKAARQPGRTRPTATEAQAARREGQT